MKNALIFLIIDDLDILKKIYYNKYRKMSKRRNKIMNETLKILAEKGYNIDHIVAILEFKNVRKDSNITDIDMVFIVPSFNELILNKDMNTEIQLVTGKEILTVDIREFKKYSQDFITNQFSVVNYNDIFENYFLCLGTIDDGLILLFKTALSAEFDAGCSEDFFSNQLSHGETRAYESIVAEIGSSGNISISAMIKKYNISRPVWTSLLKKMQEYKVADVVSQGVKGTYINITNTQLRLAALKK